MLTAKSSVRSWFRSWTKTPCPRLGLHRPPQPADMHQAVGSSCERAYLYVAVSLQYHAEPQSVATAMDLQKGSDHHRPKSSHMSDRTYPPRYVLVLAPRAPPPPPPPLGVK